MTLRTFDDVAIPYIFPTNTPIQAPPHEDRVKSLFTIVFSLKFKLPLTDKSLLSIRSVPPIDKFKTKRVFAPVLTPDGTGYYHIVLWYHHIFHRTTYRVARQTVARYLNELYPLIRDKKRPIVAIRIHLVDWERGVAVEQWRLRDKWYAERSFMNTMIDVANLSSWGMGRFNSTQADRKHDSLLKRINWRHTPKESLIDPLEKWTGLKTSVLLSKIQQRLKRNHKDDYKSLLHIESQTFRLELLTQMRSIFMDYNDKPNTVFFKNEFQNSIVLWSTTWLKKGQKNPGEAAKPRRGAKT